MDDGCDDIDECDIEECGQNEACNNTYGGFECICAIGYELNEEICVDIDECTRDDVCGLNQECQNTNGSYVCNCMFGYDAVF